MKFGKKFVSQMVPEWQDAYLDYNYLKSILKEIHLCSLRNRPTSTPRSLKRRSTMNRAFSGLTQRNNHHREDTNTTVAEGGDIEDQVILVDMVKPKGTEGVYETMFLMLNEEGGHNELEFFRKLDDEFNKVNRFYRSKVEEVMEEATLLNKQMDALISLRIKVQNIEKEATSFSAAMNRLSSDDDVVADSAAAAISASSSPSGAGTSGKIDIHEKEGYEPTSEGKFKYSDNEKQMEIKTTTETPLDILNRVKINSKNETPYSTIKYILNVEKDRSSNFGKENLKNVEEQLTRAFIEFYQKLRILKNFSFLNLTAVSKILKKYDKVTSRTASKTYLRMVDSSYIGNSDEVNRLVEKVEATFIKHFSNSNRRNGMNKLRLKAKREKHRTTFSLGFFTGCIIALLLALILIIHARQIMNKEGYARYMDNMFPLYSLFAFVVLHMVMYAANIYFWRRYRINYPFIFGFKKGTELGYREVFLLSTCLATLALAGVLANLDMEMDENTKDYQTFTELVPLGLLTLVLIITFCPFNIVYRSSRFFLLGCVFHCICAPLYKVTLPDFFLADQFTSQIQALRSLEFYICYYGWGDFRQRQNTCSTSNIYITFDFIVAVIPYLSRLLQCLRRLFEERNTKEGYNGLKYFSTIVAILVRTAYSRERGQVWLMAAVITSAVATIYTTYWDLVVDWGLLQRNSKNGWLRDKLILPHKSVYFVVMVLNVLLRLAWLQTVLNFQVPFLHRQALIAIVAILEIIRRGIWNFFRLENEHLNNVGMYRAFISVPLPFNYDEEEDRDK